MRQESGMLRSLLLQDITLLMCCVLKINLNFIYSSLELEMPPLLVDWPDGILVL